MQTNSIMRIWDVELLAQKKDNGYIRDGLVLLLDGVNNTRNGHDATATTWEDLSGNGNDFKLYGTNGSWYDDHYHHGGGWDGAGFVNTSDFSPSNIKQVEICFSNQPATGMILSCYNGAVIIMQNGVLCCGSDDSGSLNAKCKKFTISGSKFSVSMINVASPSTVCINGGNYGGWQNPEFATYINRNITGVWQWNDITYRQPFDLYSIRMYNRELTSDEILHNYEIDAEKLGVTV